MVDPASSTLLELLRLTEAYFEQRNVDAPRRSAELILGRVLGLTRLQLYLAHDRPISEVEKTALRPLVGRRGQHEPLSYVLGDHDFFGHLLEVSPAVLVPRPETEHLVDLARSAAPANAFCVDLGTGSGAIAIALALERPDVSVVAIDISAAALAVARRNVARHDLTARVRCLEGSYWQPLAAERRRFDVLLANPPYVDPAQPHLLADDVRRFEPALALFTPPGDPAAPYREIIAGVAQHLEPGALLLLETGIGAAEPARDVLCASGELDEVELLPDLAGLPRYLRARRRST